MLPLVYVKTNHVKTSKEPRTRGCSSVAVHHVKTEPGGLESGTSGDVSTELISCCYSLQLARYGPVVGLSVIPPLKGLSDLDCQRHGRSNDRGFAFGCGSDHRVG